MSTLIAKCRPKPLKITLKRGALIPVKSKSPTSPLSPPSPTLPSEPYYGETICQGTVKKSGIRCTNNAYYSQPPLFLCGVHSKKGPRKTLAKNPNAKAHRLSVQRDRTAEIEAVALSNKSTGIRGTITVSKMRMVKNPEYIQGVLNVFPNYKHENRKDGYGCSALSPKSLGPIVHNMPGLPPSVSLENFHQYSKFWKFELSPQGMPTEKALQHRIKGYKSDVPDRHKHPKEVLTKHTSGSNINIPEFSLYYRPDGTPVKYTYLECRYFYCHYYELLAPQTKCYKELRRKLDDGYNLNIVGYDGYPPNKDQMKMYMDTNKPYGHEMVLYALLTIPHPDEYPWNIYRVQHEAKYTGFP